MSLLQQGGSYKRAVDWVDADNNVLMRFPSCVEAGEFLGVTSSSVSQCIRGKTKTAGGAILKAVTEIIPQAVEGVPAEQLKAAVVAGMTLGIKKSSFSDPAYVEQVMQSASAIQTVSPEEFKITSQRQNMSITPKNKRPHDAIASDTTPDGAQKAEKKRGPKTNVAILNSALANSLINPKQQSQSESQTQSQPLQPESQSQSLPRSMSPTPSQSVDSPRAGHSQSSSQKSSHKTSKHSTDETSNNNNNLNNNNNNNNSGTKPSTKNSNKSAPYVTTNPQEVIRMPDIDAPLAAISRLAKIGFQSGGGDPQGSLLLGRDTRLVLARMAGLFVFYVSHCANEISVENRRHTMYGSDVINAARELNLGEFIPSMEKAVEAYRLKDLQKKSEKDNNSKKVVEDEDMEDEASLLNKSMENENDDDDDETESDDDDN